MEPAKRRTFGDKLKVWRTDAGRPATLQELADLLGKSQSYMLKVERGQLRPPDPNGCEKLADRLGIERDEVLHAAAEELLHRPPYNELAPYVEHLQRAAGGAAADPEALRALERLVRLQERLHNQDPVGLLGWLVEGVLEPVDGEDAAVDFNDLLRLLAGMETADLHARLRSFVALLAGEQVLRKAREERRSLEIVLHHL